MPQVPQLAGTHVLRVLVPGQATAGTTNNWSVASAPFRCKVVGARWTPDAAVTGAATNNFALGVVNKGAAGVGTTAVTTVKTYASGTNSVAGDSEDLTLSSTATDLNVAADDVIAFVRTVNGSGLASPSGCIEIFIQAR